MSMVVQYRWCGSVRCGQRISRARALAEQSRHRRHGRVVQRRARAPRPGLGLRGERRERGRQGPRLLGREHIDEAGRRARGPASKLPHRQSLGVCAESRRCQGQTRDNIVYSKPQRTPGPLQEGTGGRWLFVTPDARSRPRRSCRQGKNNKEPNLRSPRRLPRNNTRLLCVRDATATL